MCKLFNLERPQDELRTCFYDLFLHVYTYAYPKMFHACHEEDSIETELLDPNDDLSIYSRQCTLALNIYDLARWLSPSSVVV